MTEEALTPLDVLRERGWTKGVSEDRQGRLCAIGALSRAGCDYEVERLVEAVVTEQFPDRLGWSAALSPIAQFNDHRDTTLAEVEAVLEKAQLRYDERVES